MKKTRRSKFVQIIIEEDDRFKTPSLIIKGRGGGPDQTWNFGGIHNRVAGLLSEAFNDIESCPCLIEIEEEKGYNARETHQDCQTERP